VRRLVERFGTPLEHGGHTRHAFPRAEAIAGAPLARLKACGLSGAKAEALRSVARRIEAGELSAHMLDQLPSSEAIRLLRELPGIGPWSASLLLLRGFGRLDVFPPGDVGAARGFVKLLPPGQRSLERMLRRLGERRGYLYFCILGTALLGKGLIHRDSASHLVREASDHPLT
jgi:DNA-3-methyladenine glycosylase II